MPDPGDAILIPASIIDTGLIIMSRFDINYGGWARPIWGQLKLHITRLMFPNQIARLVRFELLLLVVLLLVLLFFFGNLLRDLLHG